MTGGLTVSGGASSIDARTEDMRTKGVALQDLGAELRTLAGQVAAVMVDGDVVASGIFAPLGLARIQAAATAAQLPPEGLLFVALKHEAHGYFLVGAADAYDTADATLAALADELRAQGGKAVIVLGLVAGAGVVADQALTIGSGHLLELLPDGVQDLLGLGGVNWVQAATALAEAKRESVTADGMQLFFDEPWLVDTAVAGVPAVLNDLLGTPGMLGYADVLALVLAGGGLLGAFRAGRVSLVGRPRTSNGEAPKGVSELFDNIDGAYGEKDNHQVRVNVVVGTDGVSRMVVEIPGTENWSMHPGASPADTTANLQEMAGRESNSRRAVELAVRDAIAAQGLDPSIEILLAGHSQGGIVAATMAADTSSGLNVTHVVTGGSPISGIDIPSDVSVLAIEHEQDVVPRLDGGANPGSYNVTTVTRDVGAQIEPGANGAQNVGDAHSGKLYSQTGKLLDASTDPALAHARDALDNFLTGDGTTYTYQATQEAHP